MLYLQTRSASTVCAPADGMDGSKVLRVNTLFPRNYGVEWEGWAGQGVVVVWGVMLMLWFDGVSGGGGGGFVLTARNRGCAGCPNCQCSWPG